MKSVSGRGYLFSIILPWEKVLNIIWVIECRVLTWSQTSRWGRSCSLDRESRSSWRSRPWMGMDGKDSAGFAGKRSSSSPRIIYTAEVFFGQIPAQTKISSLSRGPKKTKLKSKKNMFTDCILRHFRLKLLIQIHFDVRIPILSSWQLKRKKTS